MYLKYPNILATSTTWQFEFPVSGISFPEELEIHDATQLGESKKVTMNPILLSL